MTFILYRGSEISEAVMNVSKSRRRKQRVLTIFVAKIYMSHCSSRLYTFTLQEKRKGKKLNRRHEESFGKET